MIKEVCHFLLHAPTTLALKLRTDPVELHDTLTARQDEAGMAAQRAALVEDLSGNVLEIGCGPGGMFPYYPPGVSLTAIDPNTLYFEKARERARQSKAEISLLSASAEDMPFQTAHFDAVVISMVLCSVSSVEKLLQEVRRVLKPGGQLRLIEHVRSARLVAGALMDACNPLWRAVNGTGCNMNRDPQHSLQSAGFAISDIRSFQVFSPGLPAFPLKRIRAIR